MTCNSLCEYFFATFRIARYSSALNFRAVACSEEKPRSSSTFPRVTWVGLLLFLFIFFSSPPNRPSHRATKPALARSLFLDAHSFVRFHCLASVVPHLGVLRVPFEKDFPVASLEIPDAVELPKTRR